LWDTSTGSCGDGGGGRGGGVGLKVVVFLISAIKEVLDVELERLLRIEFLLLESHFSITLIDEWTYT